MLRQRLGLLTIIITIVVSVSPELSWMPMNRVYAQTQKPVECGAVIENEFTKQAEIHTYFLEMVPRESFTVSIEPVGEYVVTLINAYDPAGLGIANSGGAPLKNPILESSTLSARGKYRIEVNNGRSDVWPVSGKIGLYVMSVGCIKSDGTIIKPGDSAQPTPTPAPLPTAKPHSALPDTSSTFTGTGFPGLPSVDFADAVTVPLLLDKEMIGVIPIDNQILGFTLDTAAGDTLDLNYTRVSGNMNLGLVVLSANNEVFFQASLVTSESLSTRFTLPVAGQYTIGVFRISLVEPEEVEPTVFQLKGNTTAD